MGNTPLPEPTEPRVRELGLEVLRDRLSREQIYDIDVDIELAKLRKGDPYTDEIIRNLAEKWYPGSQDMFHKERTVRILLTAFRARRELDRVDIKRFLQEMDALVEASPEEPPEVVDP